MTNWNLIIDPLVWKLLGGILSLLLAREILRWYSRQRQRVRERLRGFDVKPTHHP